jgi:predicted glycosyltransferase
MANDDLSKTILGILAFGAQGIANAGLKDLYEKFKKMIEKKISGTTVAKVVEPEILLEQCEQNPDTWKQLIKTALAEAQVDKDREIVNAVSHLWNLLTPPLQDTRTIQCFNNSGSGTQNNTGNNITNNQTVYNQASEFFDEVNLKNGYRTRSTYQRNPITGSPTIVGIQLA